MATGKGSPCSSPACVDQSLHELGGDDLKVVYEAVFSIAAKYLFFGIQIGLKMNEIANIKMQCGTDPKECLLHVLSVRLSKRPALTWGDIETALRSEVIGEHEQANRIKKEYGHLYYRLDPSLQASSDEQHGASETKRVADPDKADTYGSSKFNESGEHNIFERFFGQLCCEISNPVKTAAQLQKKGLISMAVMKDMIRSPESQQAKTIISLVDAVDEAIKSKPDLLFVFIEVLLEDEDLQTVGEEILRETGK